MWAIYRAIQDAGVLGLAVIVGGAAALALRDWADRRAGGGGQ